MIALPRQRNDRFFERMDHFDLRVSMKTGGTVCLPVFIFKIFFFFAVLPSKKSFTKNLPIIFIDETVSLMYNNIEILYISGGKRLLCEKAGRRLHTTISGKKEVFHV